MLQPIRLATPLRNLSLRASLTIALGVLSLLIVGVGGISFWGILRLEALSNEAVNEDGEIGRLASDVAIHTLLLRRYEKDFFLNVGRSPKQEESLALWTQENAKLRESIDVFEQFVTTTEDKGQALHWREMLSRYNEGFFLIRDQVLTSRLTTPQAAEIAFEINHANISLLTDFAVGVAAQKGAAAQATGKYLQAQGRLLIDFVVADALVAIVLAIAWTFLFPLWILRPMEVLREATARIAHGDMSVRVIAEYKNDFTILAQTFNEMADTIQQRTGELQTQYQSAEADRRAAEAAKAEAQERLALIERQRALIREMSVPLLPLSNQTLVMPLVGELDQQRITTAQERALAEIARSRTRYLILDITGVSVVDTQVAQGLIQLVRATRLLGAEVILVGIRAEVAQTVVHLGIALEEVTTCSTLEEGVAYTRVENMSGKRRT